MGRQENKDLKKLGRRRKKLGKCWLCNRREYAWVRFRKRSVCRLVYEDDYTYVIVPRESHVKHHLLVVLKAKNGSHKRGLIDCSADDLTSLAVTISSWCDVLKGCHYDTVYTGCYSDEGHVHFHLVPLNHASDKGYSGKAMQWLAQKEKESDKRTFKSLDSNAKFLRLNDVEFLVAQLRLRQQAKGDKNGASPHFRGHAL